MNREQIIEVIAQFIFEHWQFQDQIGEAVEWVGGGNSFKQHEARDYARAALAAIEAMGAVVVPVEPTPAMIDMNKQYRTRDGREARVLMTDAGGPAPVVGVVKYLTTPSLYWMSYRWTASGEYHSDNLKESSNDLIEVKL
jgi:hypothetical protein